MALLSETHLPGNTAAMSPDSQRLEIEFIQAKLARWRDLRPDFDDIILSLISVWLRPAMDSLGMSASQLKRALNSASGGHVLLTWLAEEAFGFPYDDTTLFEQYLEESDRIDSGLHLRFLRRMANSTTTLWRLTDKPNSFSVIIEPACGVRPSRTVYDRTFFPNVNTGDILLTRFIDMPAGPILGQAVFNLGPIDAAIAEMSSARLQGLLSTFASLALDLPTKTNNTDIGTGDAVTSNSQADNANSKHGNSSATQERDRSADRKPAHGSETGSPTNSADRERLLDRIRKLFAMAQQTDSSPHEAEIALRRCQSLMSKYGINESDLHTSEFGNAEFTKGRTLPSHVKYLASAVAQLHDVLFVSGEAGFAEFRGFEVDAKVAKMTLEYLIEAVERALAARKRAGDFPAGRSAAYDYRLGFATQIVHRVTNIVKERKAAEQKMSGSGTSLTVRKMEIVDRECGHDLNKSSFSSSRDARNGTAHAAGIDDGSRVSLEQQVGGPTAPPALTQQ